MIRWVVRPDGGRPEGRDCAHLDQPGPAPAPERNPGCQECAAHARGRVPVRLCLTCGHLGCCDSSPGGHATAHYEATGHPVARSLEPGEDWAWCYADEVYLEPVRGRSAPG
ncbi:UBP-type zinc finger domain-containing protein [Streptomyces sp. NPDC058964]|uniref:UBP-type zinc finger domain-containing protein n=1 Tax=Streptomyces sp. NPDC058964 TaxID=3346681 RepID=UPI003691E727